MNYYIFNKSMDYRRGMNWNTDFDNSGLWVSDISSGEPGIFVTRILDGMEKETIWHRLLMETEIGPNMAVYVNIYGTDDPDRANACQKILEKELSASAVEAGGAPKCEGGHRYLESGCMRAEDCMKDCLKLQLRNPEDLLLWEVKARFIWAVMILWGTSAGSPKLKRMTAYFPKHSWISYLPEVYQGKGHSFLERFLAVFQVLYEELEQKIRNNASALDICSSDDETLLWLAGWLDMDHLHLWPPENLRRYLSGGAGSFRRRGTARGLTDLVSAYTGERIYLTEGTSDEDAGQLWIYVPERSVSSQAAYQALLSIIDEGKPVDTRVRIVVLRPAVQLDSHTYLGINSRISSYKTAALDGVSQLGMVMAGGKT